MRSFRRRRGGEALREETAAANLASAPSEQMPDFIDGIDDFAKLRWLNQVAQRKAAADKGRSAGAARAAERGVWVNEGRQVLQSLTQTFQKGVEGILGPHRDKKEVMRELARKNAECQEAMGSSSFECRKPWGVQLVRVVHPPTKSAAKVDLIVQWWAVMCELRRGKNVRELLHKPPNELKLLRIRELGERSKVPLNAQDLANLHGQRAWRAATLAELKVIRDTMSRHSRIPDCTSMLHLNVDGCPVCGVVHVKAVQFVRSINRVSGVATLKTLEYEVQALAEDAAVVAERLHAAQERIDAVEAVMFKLGRDAIQAWWPCVLARRRGQRNAIILRRSVWYFRVRRLVKMKRLVDSTDNNKLDFDYLTQEFCDVREALEEYLEKVQARRLAIADRVAKVFLVQLRKAVATARRKAHVRAEMLEREKNDDLTALSQKKRALMLLAVRKRVLVLERRRLVCQRPNCEQRKFFSVERFETHMRLHKLEDEARAERERLNGLRGAERALSDEVVFERVEEIREAIQRLADVDSRMALIQQAIARDGDTSFAEKSSWTSAGLPHLPVLNALLNSTIYHLEVVSMSGDVTAAEKVPLSSGVVRIGSLPALECTLVVTGEVLRQRRIAKVHCMVYCPQDSDADASITVVDNHTRYGTYVVSLREGARKVTTIATDGVPLVPGDLLCVGVRRNGADVLTATEACGACVVYRVRCADKE